MLRYIFNFAKKEVFSNLYSVRFIFTMDLICVLFLVSAFMMLSDFREMLSGTAASRMAPPESFWISAALNHLAGLPGLIL